MTRRPRRAALFPYTTLFRSGDGVELSGPPFAEAGIAGHDGPVVLTGDVLFAGSIGRTDLPGGDDGAMLQSLRARSEEHTSELQSRGHLVCRLLLEKKNKHTA